MTRPYNDTDVLLSEEEFEDMGWSNDPPEIKTDVDRIHAIASSLSRTGLLDTKEAQAFAWREIAGVDRERTAQETGMPHSR